MKATIDFDPVLFQRLKIEAAKRRRTIKDLVAEGVRAVLARPSNDEKPAVDTEPPAWVGGLRKHVRKNINGPHDLASIRDSIAKGRASARRG